MPLRLEAAADHEDWPDDEVARLRGQHMAACDALEKRLGLLAVLPAGHWMRRHHTAAVVTYGAVISYTAARLTELGLPLPKIRSAA